MQNNEKTTFNKYGLNYTIKPEQKYNEKYEKSHLILEILESKDLIEIKNMQTYWEGIPDSRANKRDNILIDIKHFTDNLKAIEFTKSLND